MTDSKHDTPPDTPDGVRMSEIVVGDERLVVLSVPLSPQLSLEVLTDAERAVAMGMMKGLSNQDIARQRGCSERTVANQVASIFRKLEVNSRAELAVRFADLAT